jgi:hypothetical protein
VPALARLARPNVKIAPTRIIFVIRQLPEVWP